MWAAIIGGLLSLITAALDIWKNRKRTKEKTGYAVDTEKFDNALVNSDTDELTRLFNEHQAPPDYGGNSSGQGDQEASKR